MANQLRRWAVVTGLSLAAVAVSAACGPLSLPVLAPSGADSGGGAVAQPVSAKPVAAAGQDVSDARPTAVPARSTGLRTAAVTRGSITETLALDGVAAAQNQVPIAYPNKATVADVKVKTGQAVSKDDVLVEMDSAEATRALTEGQARLRTSQTNLEQAQLQAAARAQTTAQRAALDQQSQQAAVNDASITLRHAQENVSKVLAGASTAERRAAQATLDTAGAALQKAQDALDKLNAGPDQDALRAAQREVATDQIALARVQADLDAVTRGPDPTAVRAAQADVQRAQTQLQIAQIAKIDPKVDQAVARIQHDAAIQDAQVAVQAAQAKLDKLKEPSPDTDVQSARQRVFDAQDVLTAAKAKLAAIQADPDQSVLDAAQANVDRAMQGAADAQAKLDEVNGRPTRAELADAQDQVNKAQAAVDAARRGPSSTTDAPAADFSSLQASVDQDQSNVAALQQALEDTRLKAPFDGTVVAIRVKTNDTVSSSKTVIVLARPGPPIVRVDLDDTQVSKLAAGQQATLQFGSGSATAAPISASIVEVVPAALDGSTPASATLQAKWADGQAPKYGVLFQVTVTLQQKQDVLLIPKSALRQAGGRSSVEIQDDTLRRVLEVQTGIITSDSVEVISGLAEGQVVLLSGTG